jgi:hypothetical protein
MWTLSRGSNTNARVCRDPRGRHGCIRQKLAAGMKSCPSSKASKRDGYHILTRDNVKRWVSRRADSPHGQSRNFAEQGSNLAPQKAGFIFAAQKRGDFNGPVSANALLWLGESGYALARYRAFLKHARKPFSHDQQSPRHGVWPTCGPNCAACIAHSFPGTLGLFCRTPRLRPHMKSAKP